MNPNQQGNPYLEMLQKTGGQGPQGTPAQGGPSAMAQALSQQAGSQAGAGPQGPQQPGQPGGGTTKILIQAVQALHGFTQQAQDQQEVAVVRSMIVILNQLITRDQVQQGSQQAPAGGSAQVSAPAAPTQQG